MQCLKCQFDNSDVIKVCGGYAHSLETRKYKPAHVEQEYHSRVLRFSVV